MGTILPEKGKIMPIEVYEEIQPNFGVVIWAKLDSEFVKDKGLEGTTKFHISQYYKHYKTQEEQRTEIGYVYFSEMPGCCGVVVVHNMFLFTQYRGSQFSDPVRRVKEKLARELGYSLMIATTRMDQIPAVQNMFKSKYTIATTFCNKRTNNLIGLGFKKV